MDDTRYAAEVMPHLPLLIRTAAALVGRADAEDAAQEALMRAWKAWPTLDGDAMVRPWLVRIVVNVCSDWQRGRFGTSRRRNDILPGDDVMPLVLPGSDPGSSDHATALDLRQAITALTPDLRQSVILRYYVGLDASEIGGALGIPAATVRTRLRRALALLRDHLNLPTPTTKEVADV
jgi:RNA polymerase sigma-70 factor (ECF subfamily)